MSETIEPSTLLVSAKTDSLTVRSRDGERLGHVQAYMVDKKTGKTSYAVLSLGGFLGMGKSFYPLPFSLLTYDPVDDAYLVTVDRRVLEGGRAGPTTRLSSIKPMPTGCRATTA